MSDEESKERRDAISTVLYTLRNPLVLMSISDRDNAIRLAEEHGITAAELLRAALRRAHKA